MSDIPTRFVNLSGVIHRDVTTSPRFRFGHSDDFFAVCPGTPEGYVEMQIFNRCVIPRFFYDVTAYRDRLTSATFWEGVANETRIAQARGAEGIARFLRSVIR